MSKHSGISRIPIYVLYPLCAMLAVLGATVVEVVHSPRWQHISLVWALVGLGWTRFYSEILHAHASVTRIRKTLYISVVSTVLMAAPLLLGRMIAMTSYSVNDAIFVLSRYFAASLLPLAVLVWSHWPRVPPLQHTRDLY